MLNIQEESEKSKNKDNFLFDNLPGVEDMLAKTLPNKDLLYYPNVIKQSNSLNVFDFTYQKKGVEIDESTTTAPTEKTTASRRKDKNLNQKHQPPKYYQKYINFI